VSVAIPLQSDFLPLVQWADDPIRVLVCDDHALFRRELIVALELESDLEVLGEADSGPEAMTLADELAPDVVLVDMGMPPYGGVATVAQVSRVVPSARMLLLTANENDPGELLEAVGAGAMGVLVKESAVEDLSGAVRKLARGEFPISPTVARAMTDLLATKDPDDPDGFQINDRERLVVEIVARGADTADAVTGLGVDTETARNLLANVVRKLQRQWRRDEAVHSLSAPTPAVDGPTPAERAARYLIDPIDGGR
jgi:DNA-binding NarL/FixJ family response regulator